MNIVKGELVGKGSLLSMREVLDEEVFELHPLIRDFIGFGLKADGEKLRIALQIGVNSIHFCIKDAASKSN